MLATTNIFRRDATMKLLGEWNRYLARRVDWLPDLEGAK
jgi:hypothetical protein